MKNSKTLAILLAFSSLSVYAQEQRRITLDEAVQLGIQNSKTLKIDEARIEEANAGLLEAKNRKLPDFKLSASALALANANVDLKIAPKNGGETPKANSAYFGNANFTLPLFAGGRIRYGIESAKYLIEASKLSAENDKTAIAYNIAQAYNNLYKSQQAIKVLQENLNASAARDKAFKKLEDNGVIARNDRLKANLQTSNMDVQQRLAGLKATFIAKGLTPDVALQSAYKIMNYMIVKQASVLAYMDVFLGLGLIFLLCIPLCSL